MTHALPRPLRRWFLLQLGLLLLALLAWPFASARAQTEEGRDPPTRVARVAELEGTALWFDPESREWQPLMRNQTLAEGDRVRSADGGRIGLRIGAHGLWLDGRAELELRRLDDERIDLELERGSLALRWLNREAARDALVRTRDGRFQFEGAGAYRIDQLARGSRGQAFEGRLRFDHRGQDDAPLYIAADEQAELWWDGGPRAERSRLLRGDAFGDWLIASLGFGRDAVASLNDRPAYRYVSPELTGADELDRYGRWEQSGDYGPVWVPLRIAVDWAPYRYGRWTWTRYWGWTWVDDLPWGYATSHYGRWVNWRGRWCWAPGPVIVPRPVFAPALVAWVGGGSVQVGVHIGGRPAPPVAWVPLAPYERYRPWYRHGPRYQQRLDPDPVTVRRPRDGVVRNREVPGAVSTLEPGQRAQRPVPVRDDAVLRSLQPLPTGPSRELAREAGLPQVPRGTERRAGRGDEGPTRQPGGGWRPERDGAPRTAQIDRPREVGEPSQVGPARPQAAAEGRQPGVGQGAAERPGRDRGDAAGAERPRIEPTAEAPRAEEPRRIEAPRRFEAPRAESPRQEMPRPEMPRAEAPRVEAPRAVEPPRRIEPPRAEPRREGRGDGPARREAGDGPRRNPGEVQR